MKTSNLSPLRLLFVSLVLVSPPWLLAEEDPEDQIKYRQNYMKAIGGHMGSANQLVRGKVDRQGHLMRHATALTQLTKDLPVLFPEGSDFGETDAKEEIWSDWEAFEQAANKTSKASAAFANAVQSGNGDAINEHFKDLGEACKGCHKKYREEEE
jgi:cytochrome c556